MHGNELKSQKQRLSLPTARKSFMEMAVTENAHAKTPHSSSAVPTNLTHLKASTLQYVQLPLSASAPVESY
eukprot:2869329-Amphidinium_carterae.1